MLAKQSDRQSFLVKRKANDDANDSKDNVQSALSADKPGSRYRKANITR